MSFFEQAGKVAQKVGSATVKIAGEAKDATSIAIEKAKIKKQIKQEQASINKDLADIGKIYLRRHGDSPSEEYLPSIRSIKMSEKNIEILNEKIIELNSVYICQGCGARLTRNQAFCKVCGTRVEEEIFEYDEDFADNVDGAIAVIDQNTGENLTEK